MNTPSPYRLAPFAVLVLIAGLLITHGTGRVRAQDRTTAPDDAAAALVVEPAFAFTGAIATATTATTIHCTNLGTASVTVRVQLFDFDNGATDFSSATLFAGRTRTVSFSSGNAGTSGTLFYTEDAYVDTVADDIKQGRGEISLDPRNAPVLCTVQILDSDSALPGFITTLPVVPVGPTGVPTAIEAVSVQLMQEPLWAVLLLAGLVLLSAFVYGRGNYPH